MRQTTNDGSRYGEMPKKHQTAEQWGCAYGLCDDCADRLR